MSASPRPLIDFQVPDDLSEWDRWGLWRYEARNEKRTKVPYSIDGRMSSTTNPRDWATYEDALMAWRRSPGRYAGLGFVFVKNDGLVGIDLDYCLDEGGHVKQWAQGIIERFADTYMEISPSGAGIKIWVRGSLPANLPGVKVGDGSIEMYDHGRYFAVTGRVFRGAPLQVEDHAQDLLAMHERLTAGARKHWTLQPLEGGKIPCGQQHSTLVSIAGTLRARRVCSEAIEACLLIINDKQCERPGPRENISRIVRSTQSWCNR